MTPPDIAHPPGSAGPNGTDGPAERPSLARMYDYTLGGSVHREIDRLAVERIRELIPELSTAIWANRGFVQRAARWMAEAGIRQFLDVGAGLPTMNNTHDVARAVHPDATVIYVDYDAEVVDHGRRLLATGDATDGEQPARIACLLHDLREPRAILEDPVVQSLIDFTQPVGLLVVGVVDFLADEEDPWGKVRCLVDAVPSGSYLAVSQDTADHQDPAAVQRVLDVFADAPDPLHFRTRSQVERFFEGLEILSPYPGARPGVTYIGLWGAEDPEQADDDQSRWWYAGIARKP